MKKTACVWINIEGTYEVIDMTKAKRMKILKNLSDLGKELKVDEVIITLYTGGKYMILKDNIDSMRVNVKELNEPNLKLGMQVCDYQYLDLKTLKQFDIPEEVGYLLGDKMIYFEKQYKNVTNVIVFDDFPDSIPLSYLRHKEIRDIISSGKRKFTVVDKYGRGYPITKQISYIDYVDYKIMNGEDDFLLNGTELLLKEAKESNI